VVVVVVIVAPDLTANLTSGTARGVHVHVRGTRANGPNELGKLTGGETLAGRSCGHVGRG
jgi:hypothetical protein